MIQVRAVILNKERESAGRQDVTITYVSYRHTNVCPVKGLTTEEVDILGGMTADFFTFSLS